MLFLKNRNGMFARARARACTHDVWPICLLSWMLPCNIFESCHHYHLNIFFPLKDEVSFGTQF